MPTYEVQINGKTFEMDAPQPPTAAMIQLAAAKIGGSSPATPDAGQVRAQIASNFSRQPIADIGAGAANLGAQSDPHDVLMGALQTLNPMAWLRSLAGVGHLALHPSEIPDAALSMGEQIQQHPGEMAGAGLMGAALPSAIGAAGRGLSSLREYTVPFADALLTKKLGIDPDALDLQSARLRLQAARARTRMAEAAAVETPAEASNAPVPRLAGKAPTLQQALEEALNEARRAPVPERADLPEVRMAPALEDVRMSAPTSKSAAVPPSAPVGPPPRLAGRGPTLQDAIAAALQDARQGASPSATLSTSAPSGAAQVEADTARMLAAREAARAVLAKAKSQNARPATPATPAASAPASAAQETAAAAPSAPAPPATAALMKGLKLTPPEYQAFRALVDQGYPFEKVLEAIRGQRAAAALSSRFGLPSDTDVAAAVADRNATGRWPQDRR